MSPPLRHRDPGLWAIDYADKVLVDCPRCQAVAVSRESGVSCGSCGYAASRRWFGSMFIHTKSRCSRCGTRLPKGRRIPARPQGIDKSQSIQCPDCGQKNADPPLDIQSRRYDRDPYSCLPLALKVEVRGGTLWAHNAVHAKAMHDYIAADLRERGDGPTGKTMLNILPKWIKSAKNRDVIAQGYQELYERGLALEGDGAAS